MENERIELSGQSLCKSNPLIPEQSPLFGTLSVNRTLRPFLVRDGSEPCGQSIVWFAHKKAVKRRLCVRHSREQLDDCMDEQGSIATVPEQSGAGSSSES